MNLVIKIDEQENKFYAIVDGKECVINFRPITESSVEYYRTFVPKELRNRGIAGALVEYALNHARENHQKVIPSCSFVRSYIGEHPDWSTIVAR